MNSSVHHDNSQPVHIAMAPSAIYEPLPATRGPEDDLPPPTTYPVKDLKFEKIIPAQPDGREKALQQPGGTAAIVIDNGTPPRASPLFAPPALGLH